MVEEQCPLPGAAGGVAGERFGGGLGEAALGEVGRRPALSELRAEPVRGGGLDRVLLRELGCAHIWGKRIGSCSEATRRRVDAAQAELLGGEPAAVAQVAGVLAPTAARSGACR